MPAPDSSAWPVGRDAYERMATAMAHAFTIPAQRQPPHRFVPGGGALSNTHLRSVTVGNGVDRKHVNVCTCFCDSCLLAGKCVCTECSCHTWSDFVLRPNGLHSESTETWTAVGLLTVTDAMDGLLTADDPYTQNEVPPYWPVRDKIVPLEEWQRIARANGELD